MLRQGKADLQKLRNANSGSLWKRPGLKRLDSEWYLVEPLYNLHLVRGIFQGTLGASRG